MSKPLVSIITPCYNGEAFAKRYFESILAQTYPNLELIFINDGSEDRTEEIALSYTDKLHEKGIRYIYERQENAGQAAALNRGLKLFTGEYLTWPDSDDVMTPDAIEKKVEFLEKNPEYSLCICKTKIVEEENPEEQVGIYERIRPEGEDPFFEDMLFLKNVYFAPGGYMVKSEDLLAVLPDRDIYPGRGGQNAQVLLPMLYHYKCGYMSDILYSYFIRNDSHSHSITDSKKMIRQIDFYENILIETLKNMGKNVLDTYEKKIKCYYAKMRFGNAVDTRNLSLISEEYKRMNELKCVSARERLSYLKIMNPIIRKSIDKIKGR